ncbi:MAG: DNA-directed RNA polymerase subunit alpha C-terminal domain-containing protein [Candidatus Aenigmatarchaeota archaeon]
MVPRQKRVEMAIGQYKHDMKGVKLPPDVRSYVDQIVLSCFSTYFGTKPRKVPKEPMTAQRLIDYEAQHADEIREGSARSCLERGKSPTSIEELELSLRAYNLFKKAGIHTAEELACYPMDLFGPKTQKEIVDNLQRYGII